jgi:DnaK suppressor protein
VEKRYEQLKRRLEEERAGLLEDIERLGTPQEGRLGYSNHMADDASDVFEQTKDLALRESLEDTLKRVEEALKRFQDGTYGKCADCGRVIEWGRLKVLPYTRLCVECVRRHERAS